MIEKQTHDVATQPYRVQRTARSIAAATTLQLDVAALSDTGYRRANNEDSFGYDLEAKIFVVCDGMGGLAGGEIASRAAVDCTLRTYKELYHHKMSPEERLLAAISRANEKVWDLSRKDQRLRGMGTTLVAACMAGKRLFIGNVGDSRAYFLRDGSCVQITEDHSYAAEQMRRGATDEISARLQQVITRAVGVDAGVEPDIFAGGLEPGDTVLLTTDGLTRYAAPQTLAQEIYTHSDLQQICFNLVAIAHRGGAEDNVTCMLLRTR